MNRCKRVGIDVTKRCNLRCRTCFYRYARDFNERYDVPFPEIRRQINFAANRGCDHVVVVGWGEPMLYPGLEDLVVYCKERGITSSIITNGCVSVDKVDRLYAKGLDHIHVSVHGLGADFDNIAETQGAHKRQDTLRKYLLENKRPWRSNTTLQKLNYKTLPQIAQNCIDHGTKHFVLLGFLPHYEWQNKLNEVAVAPAELRPYIEEALGLCEQAGIMCTLRYHPLCHLDEKYWKYVTNARHVLYDPWEWEYGHCSESDEDFLVSAVRMGENVAVQGKPCIDCDAYVHCGGWNRIYAAGLNGADLKAIRNPDMSRKAGYYFDQNPTNSAKGFFGEKPIGEKVQLDYDIVVPTCKGEKELNQHREYLGKFFDINKVVYSGFPASAAVNRNYCLLQCESDIVIMMDDDITGFYPGCFGELVEPLRKDGSVVMVSARLLNADGTPGVMMDINPELRDDWQINTKTRSLNMFPSACIAFRNDGTMFDEQYEKASWEDTDFCMQLNVIYPHGKFVLNNKVKLVHLNEMKQQDPGVFHRNRLRFNQKWGARL